MIEEKYGMKPPSVFTEKNLFITRHTTPKTPLLSKFTDEDLRYILKIAKLFRTQRKAAAILRISPKLIHRVAAKVKV